MIEMNRAWMYAVLSAPVLAAALFSGGCGSGASGDDDVGPSRVHAASDHTTRSSSGLLVEAKSGTKALIPRDYSRGVAMHDKQGKELRMSLPIAGVASSPKELATGYRYEGTNNDIIVEAESSTVQTTVVLKDSKAPDSYAFDFSLPAGSRLKKNADGSVTIVTDSERVGIAKIEKPWAKDANGAAIRTHYDVRGSTLVQVVEHAGATYPVVADPKVGFGWGVYVTFYQDESRIIGEQGKLLDALAFAGLVCVPLAEVPPVAAGCGIYMGKVASGVKDAFVAAAREGKCVELIFNYSVGGVMLPPYAYNAIPCPEDMIEAPVGADGCNSAERASANQFGCDCRDGQPFGGFCAPPPPEPIGWDGCTATERDNAGRVGCNCLNHKPYGGFCGEVVGWDGCTDTERANAARVGCGCVNHQPSGGFCPEALGWDGCYAAERENAARVGCNCLNHQPSGGFCP